MARSDDLHTDGFDRDEATPEGFVTVIDYDEFMEARRDKRVAAWLRSAKLYGEWVEREGLRRW